MNMYGLHFNFIFHLDIIISFISRSWIFQHSIFRHVWFIWLSFTQHSHVSVIWIRAFVIYVCFQVPRLYIFFLCSLFIVIQESRCFHFFVWQSPSGFASWLNFLAQFLFFFFNLYQIWCNWPEVQPPKRFVTGHHEGCMNI